MAKDAWADAYKLISPNHRVLYALTQSTIVVRYVGVYFGFIMIIFGCLLALKGVEATFKVDITHNTSKSSFETASAGLAVVVLGLVLTIATIYMPFRYADTIAEEISDGETTRTLTLNNKGAAEKPKQPNAAAPAPTPRPHVRTRSVEVSTTAALRMSPDYNRALAMVR